MTEFTGRFRIYYSW